MAFINAPGVAQFNQVFATPGGTAENVWHFVKGDHSEWSSGELVEVIAGITAWETATGCARRSAAIEQINIHGRDLSLEAGAESDGGSAHIGTLGGAALPNNVTIAIKKVTGHAGRAYRGRVYHIGCSEGKQSNDGYDAAEVAAIVSAYNNLKANIELLGAWYMCILQSQINKVKLDPRVGYPILGFASTDTTLDSQRRRLLGHNVHR